MGWFSRRKGPSEAPKEPISPAPTVCIGRDKELDFISTQFARLSSATLIFGDPLIGKTNLLEKIRDEELSQGSSLVGFWKVMGNEDVLIYALSDLLGRLYNTASLKKQLDIFIANIKKIFVSSEKREYFLRKIGSLMLPEKVSTFIKDIAGVVELKIPEEMRPDLPREVFKDIIDVLRKCFPEKRLVFIIDNLSKGFEVKVPDCALSALLTFQEAIQQTIPLDKVHILSSWKLDKNTQTVFDKMRGDFVRHWESNSVLQLEPIDLQKHGKEIRSYLEENCPAFRDKIDTEKNEIIASSHGLPKVIFNLWIGVGKGNLSKNDFISQASKWVNDNYSYISDLVESYDRDLRRILYHISVLPNAENLPLRHIAELVPSPVNSPPCLCGAAKKIAEDFERWMKRCFELLKKAVEDKFLKYELRYEDSGNPQHIYSIHDVYKAVIKELARRSYEGLSLYIKRALDYYSYHIGFATQEHPNAPLNIFNVPPLVQELPAKELLSRTFLPLLFSFLTRFSQLLPIKDTIAAQGFGQLPPHLKTLILAEALKFKEFEDRGDLTSLLKGLKPEELTYFQVLTIASALTNATGRYGERGELDEMVQCLEKGKALYETHKTPEMALAYATALTNATGRYGERGELDQMKQCMEWSKALYDAYKTPEMALAYATALINATDLYGERGELDEMGQCLERGKTLYETHKTDEMALVYASALFNARLGYKKAGDGRVEETFEQLDDFLKDKPQVAMALQAMIEGKGNQG